MWSRGARSSAAVRQYLTRHACVESALAAQIPGPCRAVLVVPAFREPCGMVQRYLRAIAGASGRVLVIVVVNAPRAQALATWPGHRELLEELCAGHATAVAAGVAGEPPAWLVRHADYDVLAVDRASLEHSLPDGQGVGLARRIGCDVALALHARGSVELPFLYCTDADAELPGDYFQVSPERSVAAIVFSFWHVPGGDPRIDAATAVYELGLRHYVSGLAFARSPYAFHTIGSTLAIDAHAYAAVRGFPKRVSGEDFYVLGKLAKLDAIWRAEACVRLASRASSRTVHGTGAAALRIAEQLDAEATTFYHPEPFNLLRVWLDALDLFARSRDLARARERLAVEAGAGWAALAEALDELGAWAALELAAAETRAVASLSSRLHTWFDAFRTLKLLHALRARGFASVPFREGLAASWSPLAELAARAPVDELRCRLARQLTAEAPYAGAGTGRWSLAHG